LRGDLPTTARPVDKRKLAGATLPAWPQQLVSAGPGYLLISPESIRGCLPLGPCARAESEVVPLPGYVWLDAPGKVLHVEERHLEFR
jgi:hypothetical protein